VTFLAMQNAVQWDQRGIVTSVGQLAMNVGGTLGVTLAGALFAVSLNASSGADLISDLLSPDRGAALDLAQRTAGRSLLADALSPVYSLFLGVTLAGLGVMALLPRGRLEPE
jgi:heme O synthase-like polyprenyltransferase